MASENNSEIVRCNNCRIVLNETPSIQYSERTPCPVCGSLSRHYEKVAVVKIGLSTSANAKAKRLGKGKPFIEQSAKHELYRETGEDHDVDRIIDREKNLYKETIRDSKTGGVIRECCEPLDKHVGHGYAKRKIKEENK
jgi:hypothetical protein